MARLTFLLLCLLTSFAVSANPTSNIEKLAGEYFALYAERKDFNSFMAMYAQEAELQDINYGNHILGRKAIRDFFQWDAGNVKLLHDKTLIVEKMVLKDNQAISRGHFTEFEYGGTKMGPWRFVIWLEFDQQGKIIKQTDWINYTPKDQFTGGKNLNHLVKSGL